MFSIKIVSPEIQFAENLGIWQFKKILNQNIL